MIIFNIKIFFARKQKNTSQNKKKCYNENALKNKNKILQIPTREIKNLISLLGFIKTNFISLLITYYNKFKNI